MDSTAEFAQLQLRFVDQTQWRYEVIRPLVLFADRTAPQRAHETATHPDTGPHVPPALPPAGDAGAPPHQCRGGAT